MVEVFYEEPTTDVEDQEPTTNEIKPQNLKLCEEVSIHDKKQWSERSKEENDPQDQVFYDASDELEDFDEPEPVIVQLRDGKEVAIPQDPKEFQRNCKKGGDANDRLEQEGKDMLWNIIASVTF